MKAPHVLIPLILAFGVHADDKDGLAARRLYYQDNSPEVVFKATTVAKRPPDLKPGPKTDPGTKAQQIDRIQHALRTAAVADPGLKAAANFGVRYNILKVDVKTGAQTEVPSDTVFHETDCARVRIQPNRGGFLFVFNEGSSGKWNALIPSREAAEDSNVVQPYRLMDIPEKYCFEIDNQPGTEHLLIIVTDKPDDIFKLVQAAGSQLVAARDLQSFTSSLQGRDIRIVRVGNKPAPGEKPFTTYQINASAAKSDSLVIKVELKHGK